MFSYRAPTLPQIKKSDLITAIKGMDGIAYQALKQFIDSLQTEIVPKDRLMDLIYCLGVVSTDSVSKVALENIAHKFGVMWFPLIEYTGNWRYMFAGITEDLPHIYKDWRNAFNITSALRVVSNYYHDTSRSDNLSAGASTQLRQIIYNNPHQASAFKALEVDKLNFHAPGNVRVQFLLENINYAIPLAEVMKFLFLARIDLDDKKPLLKKNISFICEHTITMLQQLFNKRILKQRFDTLIENSQYSKEILLEWTVTKGKTIHDFDAIIAKIKIPKLHEKKGEPIRRQPYVLWHHSVDKLPEVIFHSAPKIALS